MACTAGLIYLDHYQVLRYARCSLPNMFVRRPYSAIPCESFCSICLASACGTPSFVARIVIRYIYPVSSTQDVAADFLTFCS